MKRKLSFYMENIIFFNNEIAKLDNLDFISFEIKRYANKIIIKIFEKALLQFFKIRKINFIIRTMEM